MSGGSYSYAYRDAADMADNLRVHTVLRKAFAEHLRRTAAAMKAIEWVDSGDWGPGDEDEPIRAAMGEGVAPAMLQTIRVDMVRIADEIRDTLREQATAEDAERRRVMSHLEHCPAHPDNATCICGPREA